MPDVRSHIYCPIALMQTQFDFYNLRLWGISSQNVFAWSS